MPTLMWIRRPESGVAAARGEYGTGSTRRSGEAAVPDPVVSAASAVPGPVVSSSDVALPAVSSKQHANDGKEKKKCEINHANAAAAAKKSFNASPDRDLPAGVNQLPSGKFQSEIGWGGKLHNIGTFKTPEQASAAYMFLRKELDHAKLSAAGAEVDIAFDTAKRKALESVGVFIRDLPPGIYKTPSGTFKSMIRRGGKTYYIGTFDTLEQASATYISVKKDLDDAKLSAAGAEVHVDALFDAAQKKALESVGRLVTRKLPTGVYKARSGKFRSSMQSSGKYHYIGTFDTPEQASAAHASVKKDLSGAKVRPDPVVPAAAASAAVHVAPAARPLAYGVPVPPRIAVPPTFTTHTMGPYYQQQQQKQTLVGRHVTADDGTTTTSSNHGQRRKKRKMNHAGHATAARSKRATSERNLLPGAYQQPSGNFKSVIRCRGKVRYIGTFDTLDRASAARTAVEKEVALAKLSELGPDEVNAVFDAAKKKAIDAVGGAKKTKPKATSRRGHPLGFTQNAAGKFVSQMYWGGKNRYIGTFDTADQASAAHASVRKDLDNANLSAAGGDEVAKLSTFTADKVDDAFEAAQTKASVSLGRFVPAKQDVTAAVPANQDVSAAVPAVSSVAFPAVSSKKRETNRAKAATTAKKKFKAAPDQELPQGVCKVKSGKFQSQIGWGYTQRYIGTFEAPEQASAAYMYMSARKDLDAAKVWALNADEATAAFDAAKAKALESVGGVAQKKKKRSEQHLPKGVWKVKTGKFQTKIRWGGKQRYIGTFHSLEQASTAYLSVRKDLEDTKQSGFSADEANAAFYAAKKKALGRVYSKRLESSFVSL